MHYRKQAAISFSGFRRAIPEWPAVDSKLPQKARDKPSIKRKSAQARFF
jgi:hypothetical protein